MYCPELRCHPKSGSSEKKARAKKRANNIKYKRGALRVKSQTDHRNRRRRIYSYYSRRRQNNSLKIVPFRHAKRPPSGSFCMAERARFELAVSCPTTVFKTVTLNHSVTSPYTIPIIRILSHFSRGCRAITAVQTSEAPASFNAFAAYSSVEPVVNISSIRSILPVVVAL